MKCKVCGKEFDPKGARNRIKTYCSQSCIGKSGAESFHKKYSMKGENNNNWKGGISKNYYHYKKIQMERYPDRIRAREKVYYAIKTGKIIKPNHCHDCGGQKESKDLYAHHNDYNKPLEVVFLCKCCHRQRHNNKH